MQLRGKPLAGRQCGQAPAPAPRAPRNAPVSRKGPASSSVRCRSSSFELDEQVTAEDAAKFERIAASLVAKYSAEDGEDGSPGAGGPRALAPARAAMADGAVPPSQRIGR
jgi:hypothetical protein